MAVRIVLVRPAAPANVGASARALRNAGLAGLRLVQPGDWRTVECWRTAWGAHDVLEATEVFDDLHAAVADANYVAGLSGRRERDAVVLDVREMASEIVERGDDARVCLVFGSETAGLTLDELAACGRRVIIPTHPDQPSLNLSHAVAIAAYEVHRARSASRASRRSEGVRVPLTSHQQKEDLLRLLRDGLLRIGALPQRNTERDFRPWRALLQRVDLSERERCVFEHMARKMAVCARPLAPRAAAE